MKLTTKGRYAVTALLDMVIHQEKGPVTVTQVAERQGISISYLERLACLMREHGLLRSVRGAKGGYILARDAKTITVADIIQAVDEKIDATRCQGKSNCQDGGMCLTHSLWDALNHKIMEFLRGVTLQDLAVNPQMLTHAKGCANPQQIIRMVQHV
jgi:Rrf2 family transcriptional regulator, iron-sulfur cluster assembly transcription factor